CVAKPVEMKDEWGVVFPTPRARAGYPRWRSAAQWERAGAGRTPPAPGTPRREGLDQRTDTQKRARSKPRFHHRIGTLRSNGAAGTTVRAVHPRWRRWRRWFASLPWRTSRKRHGANRAVPGAKNPELERRIARGAGGV